MRLSYSSVLLVDITCVWAFKALFQDGRNVLFSMLKSHLNAILLVEMFGKMLGRIDTAVASPRAAKGEHEVGKAAFHVALHVGIGQLVDGVKECEYFAVVL